jgi:hypothetical protein
MVLGMLLHQPRREPLGQQRIKNRRGQHRHLDHIEYSVAEQRVPGRIEGMERDKCGRERPGTPSIPS